MVFYLLLEVPFSSIKVLDKKKGNFFYPVLTKIILEKYWFLFSRPCFAGVSNRTGAARSSTILRWER
jgi:hypothetical protein